MTASRQSPGEIEQTLGRLRRRDDLPLYEMTYVGDYDALAGIAAPTTAPPFGCSLFVASGDPAHPLFGRNFDWEPHPTLLLHADPPGGYASLSLVDISYLGLASDVDPVTNNNARARLLNAPLLPFDGMNAKGLAIGLAADESAHASVDVGKSTVGSVRIIRLMLNNAATVDEASAVGQPLRTVEESRTRLNLLGVRAQSGDSYLESTRKPAEAARAGVVREVRVSGGYA